MPDPHAEESSDGPTHEPREGHLRAAVHAARDRRRAAGGDLPGRDRRGAHPGPVVPRLAAGREPDVPAVPAGRFGPGPDRHHRSARAGGRAGEGRREGELWLREGEGRWRRTRSTSAGVTGRRTGPTPSAARSRSCTPAAAALGRSTSSCTGAATAAGGSRSGRGGRRGGGGGAGTRGGPPRARGGGGGDGYAVVAPEDLRRVIVEGCAGPQARTVARQLGLEIDEGRRR